MEPLMDSFKESRLIVFGQRRTTCEANVEKRGGAVPFEKHGNQELTSKSGNAGDRGWRESSQDRPATRRQ